MSESAAIVQYLVTRYGSSELAVAAEIQAGMLVPRAELARISTAVELDAVLEKSGAAALDAHVARRAAEQAHGLGLAPVLREVSRRLMDSLRETDTVARLLAEELRPTLTCCPW